MSDVGSASSKRSTLRLFGQRPTLAPAMKDWAVFFDKQNAAVGSLSFASNKRTKTQASYCLLIDLVVCLCDADSYTDTVLHTDQTEMNVKLKNHLISYIIIYHHISS